MRTRLADVFAQYDHGIPDHDQMRGANLVKKIAAGKFKARCLAIMDEVQAKREAVVITKRRKPVAKSGPL